MTNEPTISEHKAAPAAALFRFSLLTLLSITTLAGFTSAVVFSKGWDSLERLLMAFWCAGLILGISLGRARGKSGILSAGVGAALGCALATFMLPIVDSLVLMFVVVAGWLLAVALATVYHSLLSGLFENLWRKRMFWRASLVLAGTFIVFLIVWQLGKTPVWRPMWEQHPDLPNLNSFLPEIALSPQGDRLILNVWYRPHDVLSGAGFLPRPEELGFPIHKLTSRGLIAEEHSLPWSSAATFAPDGMRIALRLGRQYQMYDARTGTLMWETTLDLNPLEVVVDQQFSADGRQLYVTTHTPRIQRLRSFDVDDGSGMGVELFPFAGELYVSPGADKLVKFLDSRDENNERFVEIVDFASRETICRLDDISGMMKPAFSLAGDRMALGSRVWEIPEGRSQPAGGIVVGLMTNGRMLVVDDASGDYWRDVLPAWLQTMPFVHHLVGADQKSRLRISTENGQTILATPWFDHLHQVELSANQRVVVGTSGRLIRIWKVPE